MTARLRHRGPDAEGFFIHAGVGLGHRRLRVIDLESGDQPMTDASGRLTVVYNGEIYNFQSLRADLSAEGYVFTTSSDTEVLLAGYLHWGEELVPRLVGMFSFALWDSRDEVLLLVRDRLGVKPLYWTHLPKGGLAFASELNSLASCRDFKSRLNAEAVAKYLCLGYICGQASILEDCERLPPGSMIRWKRGHQPQLKRFWNLAEIWLQRPEDRRPLIEVQHEFGHLLDRAVKDRLVSDVPLGAFLSGGLDSSTIVALMLRHSKNVDTFSIGFPEASYNELPYARETARQLGTRHVDQTLDVSNPELLLEISSGQDEPFADTSIVPTYALCHMARQRVTVALSGDGGDELLAGYVTHAANALHRFAQRLPTALTALARWTLDRLPVSRRKVNLLFKAKQFMAGASLNTCDAHASWRTLASRSQLHRLMSHRLKTVQADPWNEFRLAYQESLGLSPLDRLLYVDYKTWLPDDVLVKVDRASMAHGLEVRSPFLDHRLVEFCAGLPNGLKLRRFTGKHVLRRFASGLVPQSVLRRRKAGFNAPVSHWLAGPWKSLASQAFSPDKLEAAGVLDSNAVGAIFAEHLAGRQDHGYLLFALLMLSLWLERVRPELS